MCARCAREVAEGGLGAADDDRRRGAVRRGRVSTRATPLAVVKAMARMQYVLVAHQVVGSAQRESYTFAAERELHLRR